jgi:putative addiction module antidote
MWLSHPNLPEPMIRLKITKLGSSLAVGLPSEVLAILKVGEGDTVTLRETSFGYEISSDALQLEQQLKLGREIMAKNRDVLRKLAKS